MKKDKIKILIFAMTFALIGLITLQIFWSIKTIETEEIRFDATINKVLSNVVLNLEKSRTANIIIEKVSGENGNVVWIENNIQQKDSNKYVFFLSNSEEHEIVLDNHDVEINVKVTAEEKSSATHEKTEIRVLKKFIKLDSNKKHIKKNRVLKIDTISVDKKHLISEVFEDMVSFEKNKSFETMLDEKLVDSLISLELEGNGIRTEFYFGVINKGAKDFVLIKSGANKNALILSQYVKPLSPHDIFSNSLMLKLHIPETFGLILKSIWIMFALSLLFISIIIFVYVKTVKMFLEQKKVVEVKNDLINNITHEFKTPISAISLASEALAEPKLLEQKDSVKRYSNIISEENKKLTKLVETLLNTAEFEKSKIELKLVTVKIESIIVELIEKVKIRNLDVNIELQNDLISSVNIKVDVFHFTNILNNLIDNAIKYSRDVAEIRIAIQKVPRGIEISIADKGIGISKSDQQKIFDTFFRVQTGNIHDVKGNGIGLSYAKRIVEAHNGTIKVESKINYGSTFIIFLPNEN